MIRHLDLFSGIGGWSYAAGEIGGIEPIGFCEIDAWCRRVLDKHWPGVPKHDDIKTLAAAIVRGWAPGGVDLVTASYPCQGFSVAGKRGGEADDRFLWPEVARLVAALRPRFLVCENVAGHVTLGLDRVLADLESLGYACRAVVVPAGAVNALHRRDRVWILAHTEEGGDGLQQPGIWSEPARQSAGESCAVGVGSNPDRAGREERRKPESAGAQQPAAERLGAAPSVSNTNKGQCVRSFDSLCAGRDTVDGSREVMADAATRGVRCRRASGESGFATRSGEIVANTERVGQSSAGLHGHASGRAEGRAGQADRTLDGGDQCSRAETSRSMGAQPDGLPFDVVRSRWADGSWEDGLPRVINDEPDRRRKLMAAGNAIVPQVAAEILRALVGGAL